MMKQKVTTVLVTAKNTQTVKRIKQIIWQNIPLSRVNECLRIQKATEALERGRIDFCVVGREMIEDHAEGEDLVKVIQSLYPDMPIVFHSEIEDSQYEWHMYKTYGRVIECVVHNRLLENIKKAIFRANDVIEKQAFRRFTIPKVGYQEHVDLHEIIKLVVASGGQLTFEMYNWENKYFWSENRSMSLAEFLRDYDPENDFIRVNKSEAINIYMIKTIQETGRYIELIINGESGDPLTVDIGDDYYADILARLKGWY